VTSEEHDVTMSVEARVQEFYAMREVRVSQTAELDVLTRL
jgi:hypothetical protein